MAIYGHNYIGPWLYRAITTVQVILDNFGEADPSRPYGRDSVERFRSTWSLFDREARLRIPASLVVSFMQVKNMAYIVMAYVLTACILIAYRRELHAGHSYGLYSYGLLERRELHTGRHYGLCSYGLYTYGLHSYCLHSYVLNSYCVYRYGPI